MKFYDKITLRNRTGNVILQFCDASEPTLDQSLIATTGRNLFLTGLCITTNLSKEFKNKNFLLVEGNAFLEDLQTPSVSVSTELKVGENICDKETIDLTRSNTVDIKELKTHAFSASSLNITQSAVLTNIQTDLLTNSATSLVNNAFINIISDGDKKISTVNSYSPACFRVKDNAVIADCFNLQDFVFETANKELFYWAFCIGDVCIGFSAAAGNKVILPPPKPGFVFQSASCTLDGNLTQIIFSIEKLSNDRSVQISTTESGKKIYVLSYWVKKE